MGALEDDDEDVYHRDSMSRYDTILGEEEPGDGLYGWTAPQQYTKKKGNVSWENLESSRPFFKPVIKLFHTEKLFVRRPYFKTEKSFLILSPPERRVFSF